MISLRNVFGAICRSLGSHKTEIVLFLLGFGVRFAYAVVVKIWFGDHGFIAYNDAISFYLRGAENVIHHHVFSLYAVPPYLPDAYRMPLYTFFVAFWLWLKAPFFIIIAIQNVLAGIMSVLVYRIGVSLFSSRRIGLFAAILTSLEPMSIYWNNLLMSDYLYAGFFLAGCYSIIRRRYVLFGLWFGLATLTRSIGLYFFPLFLMTALIINWQERPGIRVIPWRSLALAVAVFLAVLLPWSLRNKAVFNTWQLSTSSWYNLYQVANRYALKRGMAVSPPPLPPGYPTNGPLYHDFLSVPFYKDYFFELVARDPWSYARFHAVSALQSIIDSRYLYLVENVLKPKLPRVFLVIPAGMISAILLVGQLAWWALYMFMMVSVRFRATRVWLLLFALVIVLNAFSLGSLGFLGADSSRYMIPLAPFVFLFAGLGMQTVWRAIPATFRKKLVRS